MLNETTIEVRGVRLNMRRGGAGAPLLFLHGAQGYAGSGPALEMLARRFEVLAPDHPGFGRSDVPDWLDDVPDLAFFYLDLLDALGLERAAVVGHSLGGWIALEMAVRSTRRIKGLVLAAPAGIRIAGVPRADMFICTPDELARLLFAGDGWKAWTEEQQAGPDALDIIDKNRFAAAKFCWQPRLFDPKLEKWLHRIDRPTRILWGEEDRIIPPAYGRRLVELIPAASLALIPRAGHLLPVEAPDRFADETQRFIAGIAS
ncbi:MAG TPA: alpha/beta hydrolase [Stellaceae bacterium]|nr:alpha/beta hydrolase [Stellaceae bacterium]